MDFIVGILLLFVSIGQDLANAAFIVATPGTIYPTTTQTLSIECNIRPLMAAIKDVYVLQIEKSENGQSVSLASVTEHGPISDSGFDGARMSVTGNLSLSVNGPYIRLAIAKPDTRDKGTYVCSASTTDRTGTLISLTYQTDVSIADSISDQLMAMVANLSSEISDLREENRLLLANFTAYQTQLGGSTELQRNLSDLSDVVTSLGQTSQRLLSDMVYTTLKYDQVDNRLKVVENISTEQYSEIAKLSANTKTLAFSYTYPDIDSASSIVMFRSKLIDSGSTYNTQTGVFTAPMDGLYLLSLHIAADYGSLQVAIKVRQSLLAYAVTTFSGGIQQGSTTTVVRMSKGDTASVKVSKLLKAPVSLQQDACSFTGVFVGSE